MEVCLTMYLGNFFLIIYLIYATKVLKLFNLRQTMTAFHVTPFPDNRDLIVQEVLHHLKYSVFRIIAFPQY